MDEQPDDPRWWLREHGPKLVLLARQYVDCHADAEDVVQETFVRFWRQRGAPAGGLSVSVCAKCRDELAASGEPSQAS